MLQKIASMFALFSAFSCIYVLRIIEHLEDTFVFLRNQTIFMCGSWRASPAAVPGDTSASYYSTLKLCLRFWWRVSRPSGGLTPEMAHAAPLVRAVRLWIASPRGSPSRWQRSAPGSPSVQHPLQRACWSVPLQRACWSVPLQRACWSVPLQRACWSVPLQRACWSVPLQRACWSVPLQRACWSVPLQRACWSVPLQRACWSDRVLVGARRVTARAMYKRLTTALLSDFSYSLSQNQ